MWCRTSALWLCLVAGWVLPLPADACSCGPVGPACQEYWTAAAIFRGRVVSSVVEEALLAAPEVSDETIERRRVRFEVLEAFTGTGSRFVDVHTGLGNGDCGIRFLHGREYIVYAQRRDSTGELVTGICSRTRAIERASADLAYARAVATSSPLAGWIGGEVLVRSPDLARRRTHERPLAGAEIVLSYRPEPEAASSAAALRVPIIRAATDARGRFDVRDISPGHYEAQLELGEGQRGRLWPEAFEVRDVRGCVHLEGTVEYDGRISGRVADGAGRPMPGLTLDLTVRTGIDRAPGPARLRTTTGPDGRYEFTMVPPGTFILGVNTGAQLGADADRAFFPGVVRISAAQDVVLPAGGRIDLQDFVLPSELGYVRLTGIVLDPGGAPVADARVYIKGPAEADPILYEPVMTDQTGRFALSLAGDTEYRLFAMRESPGDPARPQSSKELTFTALEATPPLKVTLRRRY